MTETNCNNTQPFSNDEKSHVHRHRIESSFIEKLERHHNCHRRYCDYR